LLEAVEERRALRETTVPTSDADVRAALRAIKEPVTLFGEQQVQLHSSTLRLGPPSNLSIAIINKMMSGGKSI